MIKRTRLSLLYAATGSSRWFRTAVSNPDADLLAQCAWQWKNSSAARVHADSQRPALRLPQFAPPGDFLPPTRKR